MGIPIIEDLLCAHEFLKESKTYRKIKCRKCGKTILIEDG